MTQNYSEGQRIKIDWDGPSIVQVIFVKNNVVAFRRVIEDKVSMRDEDLATFSISEIKQIN